MGVEYEMHGPVGIPRIVADDEDAALEIDVRRLGGSERVRLEFRVVEGSRASRWVFVEHENARQLLERLAEALADSRI